MHCYRRKAEFTHARSFSDMPKCPGKAGHVVHLAGHDAIRDHRLVIINGDVLHNDLLLAATSVTVRLPRPDKGCTCRH